MLRTDLTLADLKARQAGTLPDQFGLEVTELQEGELVAAITVAPWMLAPNGFLHAASVVMLADTACGYATIAHLPPTAKSFTTIELKSNFMGTARQGRIRAVATAEHLGRSTQIWSATVYDQQDKKIALFRCTQMML